MRLLRESDSLEKNNLTVQESINFTSSKQYYIKTEKQQSFSITVDQAQKPNSSETKQDKPTTLQERLWMQHTIVLGCSQFTRCIPLSKRKAKIKKSGRSFCVSKKICVLQVYFTSKSWRQIWWCVNQSFKYTFYQCFYT